MKCAFARAPPRSSVLSRALPCSLVAPHRLVRAFWPLGGSSSQRTQPLHSTHSRARFFSAPPSTVEKRWTINGAITAAARGIYYYIPLAHSNERVLLPFIRRGDYVMFYGPRAASKSTHIEEAREQLANEFTCLSTTFQTGVNFRNENVFWKSFGNTLRRSNAHAKIPPIRSADDFAGFLSKAQHAGKDTKIVLFIDEFDLIYNAPSDVSDSLLNVLRGIKQQRTDYVLHSVVAAGPFSILELTGRSASPFNVKEAVRVPLFAEPDFLKVFDEFNTDRGRVFESNIPLDIYERTKGHPGLACFCCKVLDERMRQGQSNVSYEQWLEYAVLDLPGQLRTYATMQKLVDTLSRDSAADARRLIEKNLLPSLGPVKLLDPMDARLGRFLTAEGALTCLDGAETFIIPSPLIRSLLATRVLTIDRHPAPDLPLPWKPDGSLDIPALIRGALAAFSSAAIHKARFISYKQGKGKSIEGKRVPSEAAYHAQLYAVLRSWLPKDLEIAFEANAPIIMASGKDPRCDLVIENAEQRCAIELMASGNRAAIEAHFRSLAHYRRALKAQEGWLIHFTCSPEPCLDVRPPEDVLRLVTVVHDLAWTAVTVYVPGEAPVQVLPKRSDTPP